MQRNFVTDWLRYGTVTGLVFAAGAGASALHFGAPGARIALITAVAFAFGATIEWISLKFRTPATAFAVILTIAFVGTLQAYAPGQEDVGITQDLRALSATLADPDTAGEGVLSGASVSRNVEAAAGARARRELRRAESAAEGDAAPASMAIPTGDSRTGGAGSP